MRLLSLLSLQNTHLNIFTPRSVQKCYLTILNVDRLDYRRETINVGMRRDKHAV